MNKNVNRYPNGNTSHVDDHVFLNRGFHKIQIETDENILEVPEVYCSFFGCGTVKPNRKFMRRSLCEPSKANRKEAVSMKCSKCDSEAVGYFPIIDDEHPVSKSRRKAIPYCREHLEEIRKKIMDKHTVKPSKFKSKDFLN